MAKRARGAPVAGADADPALPAQQPEVGADAVHARPGAVAEQRLPPDPVQRATGLHLAGGHGDHARQVAPQHPHLPPRLGGAAEDAGAVGLRAERAAQESGDGGQDVHAGHVGARAGAAGLTRALDEQGNRGHLVHVGLRDLAAVVDPLLERDGLVGGDHHQRVPPLPGLLEPGHQAPHLGVHEPRLEQMPLLVEERQMAVAEAGGRGEVGQHAVAVALARLARGQVGPGHVRQHRMVEGQRGRARPAQARDRAVQPLAPAVQDVVVRVAVAVGARAQAGWAHGGGLLARVDPVAQVVEVREQRTRVGAVGGRVGAGAGGQAGQHGGHREVGAVVHGVRVREPGGAAGQRGEAREAAAVDRAVGRLDVGQRELVQHDHHHRRLGLGGRLGRRGGRPGDRERRQRREKDVTHSMCGVWGNMSTGVTGPSS